MSTATTATTAAPETATLVSPPGLLGYREALDLAMPAAQALDAQDLVAITVDIASAITAAVGALPGILAFRDQAKALLGFDVSAFDLLETYALAAGHAHTNYMAASAPPEAIVPLDGRGMELRQTLYTDALALARRHLISGERIAEFKANIGYKTSPASPTPHRSRRGADDGHAPRPVKVRGRHAPPKALPGSVGLSDHQSSQLWRRAG